MRALCLSLISLVLPLQLAHAQRVIETDKAPAAERMELGKVYYSYKVQPFTDWKDSVERRLLNLFPTFRDQTPPGAKELILFVAKSSTIVDKPAAQIDLHRLLDTGAINHLEQGLAEVKDLNAQDVVTQSKPMLSYRNPLDHAWCAGTGGRCLAMNYLFDTQTRAMMTVVLYVKGIHDSRIESQSEMTVDDKISPAVARDLRQLTGVSTDPASTLTLNMFYFTHVIEFSKTLAVVQPHPTNPAQSIVTGYAVFAIERKWWDFKVRGFQLSEAFLGKRFSGKVGLTQGLPKVTQDLFTGMVDSL